MKFPTKTFLVAILVAYAASMTACHLTPEERAQVVAGAAGVAQAADTNGDGRITGEEVRAAPGNLAVWGGALNTLLLLLGGGGAAAGAAANRKANKLVAQVERLDGENKRLRIEADELYDRTHTPKA